MNCPHCGKPIENDKRDLLKELAEIERINAEYAEHNPSVYAQAGRDPSEFKHPTVVVAAIFGYHGKARDGAFLGPQRDTIAEAKADAEYVEELTNEAGPVALIYAYHTFFKSG